MNFEEWLKIVDSKVGPEVPSRVHAQWQNTMGIVTMHQDGEKVSATFGPPSNSGDVGKTEPRRYFDLSNAGADQACAAISAYLCPPPKGSMR